MMLRWYQWCGEIHLADKMDLQIIEGYHDANDLIVKADTVDTFLSFMIHYRHIGHPHSAWGIKNWDGVKKTSLQRLQRATCKKYSMGR